MIEKIGGRIYELRKRQGLSQEEVAKQLGATRRAVSEWESGEAYPDIYNVAYMSELFHVSADDLLSGGEKAGLPCEDARRQQGRANIDGCMVGLAIMALTPLFAVFHSCHTESTAYIFEWPIIGIAIIGVSMAIIHGALWVKSRKGDVRNMGKEDKKRLPVLAAALFIAVSFVL